MQEMLTAFEGMVTRLFVDGQTAVTLMLFVGMVASGIRKLVSVSLIFAVVFVGYLFYTGALHESLGFIKGIFDGGMAVPINETTL